MAQSTEEPKLTLRLVVDEEKSKVVLAEACRDFVDVLFSILTLPMGNIIKLLGKNQASQPITVGCFSHLYRSVVDLCIDDFETEACKQMLMHPRSLRDVQCEKPKLNINPSEDVKLFKCVDFLRLRCNMLSNFSTSRCRCGKLMNEEILVTEVEVVDNIQNDANGVFTRGRSSFIITDDLEVAVDSTGLVLKTLGRLGYADVSKLGERLLEIGVGEVLTLLECIFSSNTPLTDTFLKKQSPHDVTQISKLLSPCVKEKEDAAEPDKLLTLDVIVRKHDMKVLYVECGEDFVDLLFTFLAVPLESIWKITGNNMTLGCIGNLHSSFKDLSVNEKTEVSSFKCVLPHYYRCQKQFPMITTEEPQAYQLRDGPVSVTLIDPKSPGSDQSKNGRVFVKRETRFTVSDDLVITPKNFSSTSICFVKKLQIQANDLEVKVISIGKAEAMSLLRASLVTSSALNTALWNFTAKMPKEES